MRVAIRRVPGLLESFSSRSCARSRRNHPVHGRKRVVGCCATARTALVALLIAAPALAQFGHPLKGTWSGDWGPTKDNRTHVVLEMNWDGKAITGNINPGPKAVPMQKAELDPATWGVHIEGDGKDAAGKTVHYTIDGKLENIGVYQRFITGTWTEGGRKGDFKIVRN